MMAILLDVLLEYAVSRPRNKRACTHASGRATPLLFAKLNAVGVASALLFLPVYNMDRESWLGACCANVTTNLRPRMSFPFAVCRAFAAS